MLIGYQNVRGLNTKLPRLYVDSFNFEYKVLVFTETWLKPGTFNSEIMCGNFLIYRKDRIHKKGGGVLIAVNCNLSSEEMICPDFLDIEFVAVSIKIGQKTVFITCSYIPPDSEVGVYERHIDAIKFVFSKGSLSDSVIILGDFNLPLISWHSLPDCGYLVPLTPCDWIADFVKMLSDLSLYQINFISNSLNRTLDLLFVDDPSICQVSRVHPISLPEDVYHPTISICLTLPSVSRSFETITSFCFSKANFTTLEFLLSRVDWNSCFNSYLSNLDDLVENFYNILLDCISRSVPLLETSTSDRNAPWFSKKLSRLKNSRNRLFKKYKKSGSILDFAKYSVARSSFNLESGNCYRRYLDTLKCQFKSDPKSFYNFVNSKRKCSNYPSSIKVDNVVLVEKDTIANAFADFFASTYSTDFYDRLNPYPYSIPESTFLDISELDPLTVLSNLRHLKSSNNSGPDGIPSCILRNCADVLYIPLTYLFNLSLSKGYFPAVWRRTFIIPLHKSGSRTNVSNYRGIAKLSAIPKLFEKLITDILSYQVSSIISPDQHGFRKGHSTVTNLMEFSSIVIDGFVAGKQTDAIYTDFSKAFDKVNHELLLYKLNIIGLSLNLLKWIRSYLVNREQSVLFGNVQSRSIRVTSGVPQGSHLGPVLFLLFINDLPLSITNSRVLLFADDVKIFLSYIDPMDSRLLQNDLDSFSHWCNVNHMVLNVNKCKHMSFSRSKLIDRVYLLNGIRLERVNSFVDLGVLLDMKMNFNSHIITMVNKAYGVLGFIKRWAKEFSDPYVTKQLYTSLVRPILEYGSVVWDPHYNYNINMIESVQKQFLLFSLRTFRWDPGYVLPSYESRLSLIKLPTLKSRRTMLNVIFVLKILNGDVRSEFMVGKISFNIPFRTLRSYQFLCEGFQRSNYAYADPNRRIIRDFNSLYRFIDLSSNLSLVKSSIIVFLNMIPGCQQVVPV